MLIHRNTRHQNLRVIVHYLKRNHNFRELKALLICRGRGVSNHEMTKFLTRAMGAIREADMIGLAVLMTCTWPGNAKSYIRRSERYWGNTYITEYQADGEYFLMSFSTRNASSEYRFAKSYTPNEISSFLPGTHEYWYVGFYYFHIFYSTCLYKKK